MTAFPNDSSPTARPHLKVWDVPVRVFHWVLALSVLGAFVTNRLGVSYFQYHLWFGYAVIVAVAFRVLWGVMGSHHALFRSFVRGPKAAWGYGVALLRGQHHPYAGHNPLGAWMVLALLGTLAVQAGAGLFGNDQIFNVGPLNGYVGENTGLALTSLHRKLFYVIAAAAAVHVLAVLVHVVFFRENLIKAMFTGLKPAQHFPHLANVRVAPLWLALLVCMGLGLGLTVLVSTAPVIVQEAANF